MNKPLTGDEITEKRTMLLDCAMSILENEGAGALTVRRLAESAGVSRQTPYLYFKDKAALVDAMRIAGLNRLTETAQAAVAGAEQRDLVEQLRLIGEAYVRFGLDNPALYKLVFTPIRPDEPPTPEHKEAIEANQNVAEARMKSAWQEGLLAMPPDRLNNVFWAALHGLISLRNEGLIADGEIFEQIRADMDYVLACGFINRGEK
ncbi:TetR/AcrR family transcriptional regulator [Hoeflea poritis]|uniref:TetR/AcrR family transcriptional regulator n=1 Tax=Hoeflea poritis TaxID=2993659 RepID=A0ABT4VHA0_9HYPH|nr:TetR/AcrR family transcriptional regulator [Hoeflea poritis]MDA4844070.1 TetR/AcrR family transcriptional regulator [Hoeflea poritis]